MEIPQNPAAELTRFGDQGDPELGDEEGDPTAVWTLAAKLKSLSLLET